MATWQVDLPSGKHVIQFEHGTTTGKRVLRIDGVEIFRRVSVFVVFDFVVVVVVVGGGVVGGGVVVVSRIAIILQ